ncbi:putative aldo-keto reductase [Daldinia sp. FL1419]|nr:putative aldo-keto reductase [Daldinia sp. FL1419]
MPQLSGLQLALGHRVPLLLYGTAWKEEATAELTEAALTHGFRGLDTANCPSSYDEPLVGVGLVAALKSGIKREDLFIQSKFTPSRAHGEGKTPFNPNQDIEGQIRQSIQQTLDHLKLDYLDSLLLHQPYPRDNDNSIAWRVFESYVPDKIRYLGVSNIQLPQIQQIYEASTIKPVIVQNGFHRGTMYDLHVRSFCKDHGIIYQAFWTLRHNRVLLESDVVRSVGEKFGVDKGAAMYLLLLGHGDTQILDGTTKPERMEADIKAVAEVFANDDKLDELQPFVVEFKRLLWKLVCKIPTM